MITEIVDILIQPGKQAEFEAAVAHGLSTIHTRAKGMLGYKVHKCIETPERYVLEIQWTSVEAHMVGYRESPLSPEFRALVSHYYARPTNMQHFELLIDGK